MQLKRLLKRLWARLMESRQVDLFNFRWWIRQLAIHEILGLS
jgi:hypothetical protein